MAGTSKSPGTAAPASQLAETVRYFSKGDIDIIRRIFALCAAAGLGLTALAATSPAQAAFHLIRWEGTGICQVWDQSIPTKPFPSDYKTVSKPLATFGDALAVKDGMLKKGACKL